jgi:hypothetical protein
MLSTGRHILTFAGSAGSGHVASMHSTHWLKSPRLPLYVAVAPVTVYSRTSVWTSQLSTTNALTRRSVATIVPIVADALRHRAIVWSVERAIEKRRRKLASKNSAVQ